MKALFSFFFFSFLNVLNVLSTLAKNTSRFIRLDKEHQQKCFAFNFSQIQGGL